MELGGQDGIDKRVVCELAELGCCVRCILRFSCCTDREPYLQDDEDLQIWCDGLVAQQSDDSKSDKDEAAPSASSSSISPPVCISCLGILQFVSTPEFRSSICSSIKEADYEFSTFNLAISIPSSITGRFYSIWFHLERKFGGIYKHAPPTGEVTVKDIARWMIAAFLTEKLNVTLLHGEGLGIHLTFQHSETIHELDFLQKQSEGRPSAKRRRTNRGRKAVPSHSTVVTQLAAISADEFASESPIPPPVCNTRAELSPFAFRYATVLLSGRYNKYARNLSHTPMMISGVRKTAESVQELCCVNIVKRFQCETGYNFFSSGREDIDVRMLGRGRPFVIELFDAHRLPFGELKEMEDEVNGRTEKVQIHDLKKIDSQYSKKVKESEGSKKKTYRCVVRLSKEIKKSDLAVFDTLCPLVITQKTPIRVLHRRTLLDRKRTVYSFHYDFLNNRVFTLDLQTQAGTYIKEFVHGDWGRSLPNVGSILGCTAEILQLDVLDLELDE